MLSLLKNILIIGLVITGSILLGQVSVDGRTVGSRLSAKIGWPTQEHTVQQATDRAVARVRKEIHDGIPGVVHRARRQLALWIYPSVAKEIQPRKR